MSKWIHTLIGGLAAFFLVLQLVPAETSNPPVTAAMETPTGETGQVLRAACMDCHSNETVWPWYSKVAPIKFFISDHVEEGREHLNFSVWGTMSDRDREHAFEEVVEVIEEGEMPLASYTILHGDAKLTDAQRSLIVEWARAERARLRAAVGMPTAEGGPDEGNHEHDEGEGH
jgi:hypothetical protein